MAQGFELTTRCWAVNHKPSLGVARGLWKGCQLWEILLNHNSHPSERCGEVRSLNARDVLTHGAEFRGQHRFCTKFSN